MTRLRPYSDAELLKIARWYGAPRVVVYRDPYLRTLADVDLYRGSVTDRAPTAIENESRTSDFSPVGRSPDVLPSDRPSY